MTTSGAVLHPAADRSRWPRIPIGLVGVAILLIIALPCFVTLPWSIQYYEGMAGDETYSYEQPTWSQPMGTDSLGRSMMWRCLLGGAISLGIGFAAAMISVVIGVTFGTVSGYLGGRVDAMMMRVVDVLFGLPYILLVVLLDLALKPAFTTLASHLFSEDIAGHLADVVTLLIAIGGVSWLTLARVIRGQVLSLRGQPFIEAARACGAGPGRIVRLHLLPNLVGPIVVYTTLTVPMAVLQESFLSFLGIGVQLPLPSWGNLAADGIKELLAMVLPGVSLRWWLPLWPCVLLGMTLMALNFMGDALRNRLDPKKAI
jgi:ABC-type dipeptide/oligopeptide/nickel transport system permease subunit